jgi:hypothetical protein
MFRIIVIVLAVMLSFVNVSGQLKIKEKANIPMFSASFALQVPQQDLKERFGMNSNIGGDFLFKTKSGWLAGIEVYYLFGDQVKEDSILDGLRTANGEILNEFGEYANVLIYERGYYLGAKLGKLIPLSSSNPNSGIMITLSAGFLEHKIRIDNQGNTVPQLVGDYKKGYDRLSNGFSMREFVGYMYIGENQFANFFAGVEFYQSWTMNRRSINFDTKTTDNRERRDDLIGFRLGWIIPLYRHMQTNTYYTE